MSAAAPDWLAAALTCLARGLPCTLVTVAAVEGSAPREAGTKMLVHLDGIAGFRFLNRFTFGNFGNPSEFGLET